MANDETFERIDSKTFKTVKSVELFHDVQILKQRLIGCKAQRDELNRQIDEIREILGRAKDAGVEEADTVITAEIK